MLPQGVLLAFFLAVLNVAFSAPVETIIPVDLNHRCFNLINEDQSKSPILLIHGITNSLQTWSGVMETLAMGTGRRVCAVDLRDHGDSPRTGRIDVEALTKDIEHFLDKESIKKVNIVGHSLGGKIAVHFSLNSPERLDSFVSEDFRPNTLTKAGGDLLKRVSVFLEESIKSVPEGASEDEARKVLLKSWKEMMPGMTADEAKDEATAKNFQIRQVNGKWEWQVNIDAVDKAVADLDTFLTKSTGVYRGPALFIYGSKSPFDVGGDKENIMKLFPNAKLVPVEGGHAIHLENRRQFTDEWIPSHVGVDGNEKADLLAKSAAEDDTEHHGKLTFCEISSLEKIILNRSRRTPPNHSWYFARKPGDSFHLKPRAHQTAFSRFLSGHTGSLTFNQGQKSYPECHWCSKDMASPAHILACLGFSKDEVLRDPSLFMDFLEVFGFMGVV